MERIIEKLRDELISKADPGTKKTGERFFREEVNLYGIRSSLLKNISRTYYKTITDKSKQNIFLLCEEL